MFSFCSLAYVNKQPNPPKQKVNTNIFMLKFLFIQDESYQTHSGKLIECSKCNVFFNKYSSDNLIQQSDIRLECLTQKQKNLIEQAEKQYQQQILTHLSEDLDSFAWVCEFCGFANILNGKPPQMNKAFIHLHEFFNQENQIKKQLNANQLQESNRELPTYQGEQLLYVLDNSGSMSTIETYNKNGQKISLSRKQSIISSIEEQSKSLMKDAQEKSIQLIIFSSEVDIYTDVNIHPSKIQGDCLENWDSLVQSASQLEQNMKGVPASEIDRILNLYRISNKMGSTALGPAALAAVAVTQQNRGSQVVICTDGEANIGMGSLKDQEKAHKFYVNLANYAKDKGIQISVLGIGMGLKEVGKLADLTNGSVFKIDLSNLNQKLDNILSDKMIASDVKMKLYFHKNIKLDDEYNGHQEIDFGNATRESCMTFEYFFIDAAKMDGLEYVPFQAHVEYTDLNGLRQLVIVTDQIKISSNIEEVDSNLNVNVVEKRMVQQTANFIQKGEKENAIQYKMQWKDYMEEQEDYQDFLPQQQQYSQMVDQLVNQDLKSEEAQVQLQQMQKGKFWG